MSTARINMRCKKRGQDPESGIINNARRCGGLTTTGTYVNDDEG
jgi:hypothetical protein